MRTSEVDIVVVPGWSDSGPDHWQSRWCRNLKTARRVVQDDWINPNRDAWVGRLVEAVNAGGDSGRPIVLVGHSLGVATIVHAAPLLDARRVIGAFLVAPADVERSGRWPVTQGEVFDVAGSGFGALPCERLPFATVLVASSNDPYCAMERARELGARWGAEVVEAGEVGHINSASGHGPWPEGLLRFGAFLKTLPRSTTTTV